MRRRTASVVARLAAAVGVAAGLVAAGPVLPGSPSVVRAHATLVSSAPGAGETLGRAPTEIRLAFSEPVDARYTSADVLDREGRAVVTRGGAPDPTDGRAVVVPLPSLGDGSYTVSWRALSASDGHVSSGFFTFAVGATALPPQQAREGAAAGGLHAGHTAGQALLDTQARTLVYLGFMLAFGLAVVAAVVLRPVGRVRPWIVWTQGAGLLLAAVAGIVVGLLAGMAPGVDPVGYLTEARPGQLLVARGIAAAACGLAVLALARAGQGSVALAIGAIGGAVGIVGLGLGGHAAAAASQIPFTVLIVHLAAAAVWLAGVVAIAWLVIADRDGDRAWVPGVVSRFSALALVTVTLVALTGIWQAWLQTGDLLPGTAYGATLWVKVAIFAGAITLGALDLLEGGQTLGRLGGLRTRLAAEAVLGVAVLVTTATLAAGSPPAPAGPVALAGASDAGAPPGAETAGIACGILPGRPGPARFVVTVADVPAGSTVDLDLVRVDGAAGDATRVRLRPIDPVATTGSGTSRWVADGTVLAADSAWDATIIVRDSAGGELSRRRFPFALDETGVSAGQATPVIDPTLAVAAALILLALLGAVIVAAGGAVPRVDRRAGRLAVAIGSVTSGVLGVAMIVRPAP